MGGSESIYQHFHIYKEYRKHQSIRSLFQQACFQINKSKDPISQLQIKAYKEAYQGLDDVCPKQDDMNVSHDVSFPIK